jgi:nucleotide sugar dehydrogenase
LVQLVHEKGFPVIGLDIDAERVRETVESGIPASTMSDAALNNADCIVVCVPTPVDDRNRPDLSSVVSASKAIARNLKEGTLVVLESTVAPGTTEDVVVPLLEGSGLRAGRDFFVAHCPERVDPGNTKWTVRNIPRVVGGIDEESTEVAYAFYTTLLDAEVVKLTSARTAEAVKIVENAFRDVNIAFVNELARSFDRIGIDLTEVIKGASTKPFGFLPHYPGCGVGGHCIAVDPYHLIAKAGESGFDHRFLKLAREINSGMPRYAVDKTVTALKEAGVRIQGAKIAVLGLAYKGGVDDTRESPAFPIIERLEALGADVTVFDPHVTERSTVHDMASALEGRDCVVIVTDHPEFRAVTADRLKEKGVKAVMDGRNILSKGSIEGAGIVYKGIGR